MALIDLGSRIRAASRASNDGAGEAAGNAILALLIGRDVPGLRGRAAVRVSRHGRRRPGQRPAGPTPVRRQPAASTRSRARGGGGGLAGADRGHREPLDAGPGRAGVGRGEPRPRSSRRWRRLGATTTLCTHGGAETGRPHVHGRPRRLPGSPRSWSWATRRTSCAGVTGRPGRRHPGLRQRRRATWATPGRSTWTCRCGPSGASRAGWPEPTRRRPGPTSPAPTPRS